MNETHGTLLETDHLTRSFGELVAVNDVSLTVREGEVSAVIGPNGAGKSTLFNLICGLISPSDGRIIFNGNDITGEPPHKITRRGIGRSFQIVDIFEGLSVHENVRLAAQRHDGRRSMKWRQADTLTEPTDRANRILADVGLNEGIAERADTLSHGDRRKLDIAITIATDPDLILLDEPTAGLGKEASVEMVSIIEELTETRDITMVLVEHDLEIVWDVSDVINVMHDGDLLATGSPSEIRNNPDVERAYLGTEDDE